MSIEQLIQTGGALSILAGIILAFYANKVITKAAADEVLNRLAAQWTERLADERAEKEAWKAQAQQLAPAVVKMAAELEEANARDEAWKAALVKEGIADRRLST